MNKIKILMTFLCAGLLVLGMVSSASALMIISFSTSCIPVGLNDLL